MVVSYARTVLGMKGAHSREFDATTDFPVIDLMDEQANGYFPNLDKYYLACVAGGRGSFVVVVRNYKDYSGGMRRKLVLEISQNDSPIKQVRINPQRESLFSVIAAAPRIQLAPGPQVLRPAPNEFSNQCDNVSGPFSFGNF